MKKIAKFIITIFIYIFEKILNILDNPDDFDPHNNTVKAYTYFQEKNKKLMDNVLEYFENDDSDSFKNLFSESVKQNYNLDLQINKAFKLYQSKGKPVFYGEKSADEMGRGTKNGYNYYLSNDCEVTINFNSGEKMEISFCIVDIDDNSPNRIGMSSIWLKDESGKNLRIIGAYDHYQKDIAE